MYSPNKSIPLQRKHESFKNMKKVMIRKETVNVMWMTFLLIFTGQAVSAKPKSMTVHPYVPFTIPETGPGEKHILRM